MLKHLNNYIYNFKKANGLELVIENDERIKCRWITLTVKNKNVVIDFQRSWHLSEHASLVNLPIKNPLNVVLNGKGIILKKIDPGKEVFDHEVNIQTWFPQANLDEFYYEVASFSRFSTIAIARKELVDKILGTLKELELHAINLHLGFSTANLPLSYLADKPESVLTDSYILELEEGTISNFNLLYEGSAREQKEFQFASQYIRSSNLISLGAAMELLADGVSLRSVNGQTEIEKNSYNYKDFLLFKFRFRALLVGFLVVLIANFILFSYYYSKNQKLENARFMEQGNILQKTALQNKINQKQRFLTTSGWLSHQNHSFFADRIASLAPSEITLTSLTFNPHQAKHTRDHSMFKTRIIEIHGLCGNPIYLNQYINNLRNIKGVQQVSLISFNHQQSKSIGTFFIEINLF